MLQQSNERCISANDPPDGKTLNVGVRERRSDGEADPARRDAHRDRSSGASPYKGFVCPRAIEIETVLDGWVIEPGRDLTAEIIADLVDDEAPLRHPDDDEERICVTSVKAVDEYVREAEKDLI